MRHRIAMWAVAGFMVALYWALWFFPTVSVPLTMSQQIALTLARLTCPVVMAASYFHVGLYFYWVLLANAATYALVGLLGEGLRRQPASAT